MGCCYLGYYIARDNIHMNITTCNTKELDNRGAGRGWVWGGAEAIALDWSEIYYLGQGRGANASTNFTRSKPRSLVYLQWLEIFCPHEVSLPVNSSTNGNTQNTDKPLDDLDMRIDTNNVL